MKQKDTQAQMGTVREREIWDAHTERKTQPKSAQVYQNNSKASGISPSVITECKTNLKRNK